MRQYGLIGYPLTHSFSKQYFSNKFEKEKIYDCVYQSYPLQLIDELSVLLKSVSSLCGLNVTIPYKERVLPFLTHCSPVVEAIGACNCIVIEKGKLVGHNTDVIGFENALRKKWQPLLHKNALVLGTGGAAKAVQWVLTQLQINYLTVSRWPHQNEIGYKQLTETILKEHLLIVNTTPLGMHPNVAESPHIPYQYIGSKHYLFDLIYNPEETAFLQKGREQGALTENGMDMLIIQAEESWKIWNKL